MSERFEQAILEELRSAVRDGKPIAGNLGRLKGPSSTWTYLVDENSFGRGLELLKGGSIGFAASPMAVTGPLFVLSLIMNRLRKRK